MPRIKIDAHLYNRVKKVAETAGYSSPQEFILYIIEKELATVDAQTVDAQDDEKVIERLRGLGYLE